MTSVSKILTEFTASVDASRDNYTLNELKTLLTQAYKSNTKRKSSGVKKEPSKYNIFIKEEIAKIRQENPSVENKQLMSLAAARWKEFKATQASETAK